MPITRSKLCALLVGAPMLAPISAFAESHSDPVNQVEVMPTASGGGGGAWDARFGGIPGGSYISGGLGFSNLPRIGYHLGLGRSLEIGGAFAFDIGYYAPDGAVSSQMMFMVPIRLSLSNANKLSMGITFDPGINMQFRGAFGFGLLFNAGFNAGYYITPQFMIGGGIDLPMGLRLTNGVIFAIPILFGPVVEFHPMDKLAVFFDMKFGPHITAGDFGTVIFGMKMLVGLAYRL
jgi:hypothetical protein